MSTNHLETIKQVAQHLETIIEKIDGLEYCPFTWDEQSKDGGSTSILLPKFYCKGGSVHKN